jgi:hypothetical protein
VLNEYHWTPHKYARLTLKEKALVIASIELRQKEEKKQEREAKRKAHAKHI